MSFRNSHLSSAISPSFTVDLTDVVLFEGDPLLLEFRATSAPPPHTHGIVAT